MNLITWNCNMAFRKKWKAIISFQPDLLIIQECEHPTKFKANQTIPNHNQFIWIGENRNKGVGIISFNNYEINIAQTYNEAFKYIVPIKVSGEKVFDLFAIWAMPKKNSPTNSYIAQIWKAINFYQGDLKTPSILIGDWNSHVMWNDKYKIGNHSQVIEFLKRFNIVSAYHQTKFIEPGEEQDPTFFLLKNKTKPYHLDYCFASKIMFNKKTTVKVGSFDKWIEWSDHMPLLIENIG